MVNYAEYIADYASLGDFCTNVQKHPPSRRRRDGSEVTEGLSNKSIVKANITIFYPLSRI